MVCVKPVSYTHLAGEIVGIVDPKETTENELGLLMAGYSLEEARAELSKVEAGETVE